MIQRDDRRRFGQAVSLDDDESQPSPERFELGIERRRADDDRPELEAEHPVHARGTSTSAPSSASSRRRFGRFRRHAHDVIPEHLEDLRHAHQHRDASLANLPDDVVGRVAAREQDQARQHRRHECPHRLAEHVAERQKIEKANRQERLRPLPVLRDLLLDGNDVGEDVPVGDDDALGIGGRAGREDDLRGIVRRQLWDLA